MNIIRYPNRSDWAFILKRSALKTDSLQDTVREILDKVRTEGDKAVKEYEEKFDHVQLDSLRVTEEEFEEAEKEVGIELKAAIMLALNNIRTFHAAQKFEGKKIQTLPGVTCWQKSVAIEKVGLYVPGGTAPLFSTVLMLATPAQIAGCKEIVLCSALKTDSLQDTVREILDKVRTEGDKAVKEYEEKFDHVQLDSLRVTEEEFEEAEKEVGIELKAAIMLALNNIRTFHAAQKFEGKKIQTLPGVTCWQKSVAIEKVGLYVPGGTAPLFSTVLMLATPAQIAGCKEIVLCTPPNREGKVHPAVLYAARAAGVNKVFKAGGVQAIGAMAYGTTSIPKVYKIFGPGNQFVTVAKQQVSLRDVAIDMPAGPSEVAVLADDSANPVYVAADLLSQAEHGADSQAMLITTSETLLDAVTAEVEKQLAALPRKELASRSLESSKLILVNDMQEAVCMVNEYAPEHLIIETSDYNEVAAQIINAGSVFLGSYSPESAGDYASGTNHTLPTNGYAKAYSGVSLDSFIRKITFQEITREGIATLGPAIQVMAANEHLDAHKNAVTVRLENNK